MTRRIGPGAPACGFRCGKHALDDYLARYSFPNDQAGIGRAYVLEASPEDTNRGLPAVLGYYTLSMAMVASADVGWDGSTSSASSVRDPNQSQPVNRCQGSGLPARKRTSRQ